MPSRPTLFDIEEFKKEKSKTKKTTHKETWKLFERNVAKDFHTTRTPLSGMVKTITNSDTLHKKIYVECKLRGGENNFKFWELFESLREKTGIEAMVIENKITGEMLYLMTRNDFFRFMEKPVLDVALIEVVNRNSVYKSLLSLFAETRARAEIERKIPIVAVKKKNKKSYLIGTHPNRFKELHKILKRGKNVRD